MQKWIQHPGEPLQHSLGYGLSIIKNCRTEQKSALKHSAMCLLSLVAECPPPNPWKSLQILIINEP